MEISKPLTGNDINEVLKQKIIHEPIAEGLLYKGATLMLSSPPGLGKSSISIQAALQLSIGQPLFSSMYVPCPVRVWYIQMERDIREALERLQLMIGESTPSFDNL